MVNNLPGIIIDLDLFYSWHYILHKATVRCSSYINRAFTKPQRYAVDAFQTLTEVVGAAPKTTAKYKTVKYPFAGRIGSRD